MVPFKTQILISFFFSFHTPSYALPRWVSPAPQSAYKIVTSELSTKRGDYFKRTVKRIGNQTIEMEGVASINGKLDNFYQIAKNVPAYRTWALPNINQRPAGGQYLIKILDLKPVSQKSNQLIADFGINLPGIRRKISRGFSIFTERGTNDVTVTCESNQDRDSILSSLTGYIIAFPAPKQKERLWVYFKGRTKLESWLLYQAIPEKLLAHESSDRIQTVLDNFGNEESTQMSK
ncbi:MAG: hypothetical protein EBQ92_04960 [Proteobacteria bacterium]|nr:hypothetical protein [Pseudomonadota bacterium]